MRTLTNTYISKKSTLNLEVRVRMKWWKDATRTWSEKVFEQKRNLQDGNENFVAS